MKISGSISSILALHRTLHDAGMRIYVAGDIQVQHELSLQDYRSLPIDRLRNFLQAESAFFDLYKGALENQVLTATLLFLFDTSNEGFEGRITLRHKRFLTVLSNASCTASTSGSLIGKKAFEHGRSKAALRKLAR